MCRPQGDPKCPCREKSQKPPIYPFNCRTPQQWAGEGRKRSSRPLPSASSSHKASLGSQQARMPETPSSLLCPLRAGHLGTPLVPIPPPREEQETASLTLSLLPPPPAAARASAAAVEGGVAELLVPLRRLSLFLSLDRWGALGVPPSSGGVCLAQHPRQSDPSAPQDCSLLSASFPPPVTFKCIFYCSTTLYLQIIKSTSRAHQDRPDITVL